MLINFLTEKSRTRPELLSAIAGHNSNWWSGDPLDAKVVPWIRGVGASGDMGLGTQKYLGHNSPSMGHSEVGALNWGQFKKNENRKSKYLKYVCYSNLNASTGWQKNWSTYRSRSSARFNNSASHWVSYMSYQEAESCPQRAGLPVSFGGSQTTRKTSDTGRKLSNRSGCDIQNRRIRRSHLAVGVLELRTHTYQ